MRVLETDNRLEGEWAKVGGFAAGRAAAHVGNKRTMRVQEFLELLNVRLSVLEL